MPFDNLSDDEADREWAAISPKIRHAIKAGWESGMPTMASALYCRWWQLETWLRLLIYVELKAARGGKWVEALEEASESRQLEEHSFRYMATSDAQNRLAYTDASGLFKIMSKHWNLFESSLLPQSVWAGRIVELLKIRNRIGHCRRPHADDLARLEQTLRDLNRGAFLAASAFNRQFDVDENWTDAVVEKWVRMQNNSSSLVAHAERQYETIFSLQYSRRPWVNSSIGQETISGIPGYIWHACWVYRRNGAFILSRFWQAIRAHHNNILMLCADTPSSIEVSFSAMEDPETIADAINECFHAALRHTGSRVDDFTEWEKRYAEIDPRVQVTTPWTIIDTSMQGVSVFNA
jgi:hypothetical protein